MAYSDYVGGAIRQRMPIPQRGTEPTAQMYETPMKGPLDGMGAGTAPVAQQPQQSAAGMAPVTTRQDALQNVQQAYQGRMPGQMDALNAQLTGLAQPVGLNDPGLAPALRAGQMGDQRNFERQRSALAELLGAQGLGDSGAMNTQTLGIAQRIGEQGAARDAGLVYDEMGSRRNALLGALGMDQSRYAHDNQIGLQLSQLEALLNQQAMQPFV
jgi:hypothetical protein